MEPFEGGPGQPTSEKPEEKLASRPAVMETAAWATALFILALFVVGGGGLLMLEVGWQSLLTWAVLVFPLLLASGVCLRKLRGNQRAKLAQRMSKTSAAMIATGAIGLSVLAAVVSFVYCSTEFSKALVHH
ncbi:hypothetical protein Pan97_21380 [Bremerella volcania]|uniref:Transmembrane protein n=1 Tax=Bremerella volcania TaxID=2527984 RepID=A0A518C7B1_9BACT|nr:hypothetical protein [Bremerella volcania]QDU75115.1 hypothetical protein Pan97_21380 [Bremerella volcania]